MQIAVEVLDVASLVGGIYDYIVATFGVWTEVITTTAYSWGQALADKFKFVFSCNTGAAVLGLGYIVGLKYAFVIFAGSIFVWWFIIPLMMVLCVDILVVRRRFYYKQ